MKVLCTITTYNKDAPPSVIEIDESLTDVTIEMGDGGISVSVPDHDLSFQEIKWLAGPSMRNIPHEIFDGEITLYPKPDRWRDYRYE